MRIYLDLCCYNRPYDEQDNIIVRLESEAKLFIQGLIRDRQLELVWSSMLDYENKDNQSDKKCERIAAWKKMAVVSVRINDTIQKTAANLMTLGIKNNDAIPIASAVAAHVDYFITTDKRILNKPVAKIMTINSLHFLERYEDDKLLENDVLLKRAGMEVLTEHLGLIEAERFVMLLRRESFDYTEWRRTLYKNKTLEELCDDVKRFEKINDQTE
ncbi:MAG: hypothetical protein LBT05_09450 [Planctomycetaceae bacterium]|jgi:hypothetical protein|nr:hypothetical protein [Planctomycetaceae bacterium]